MTTGYSVKRFEAPGDFSALRTAEVWCKENGYSYGRLQGRASIGIRKGAWNIAKWRNMSAKEQGELDGMIKCIADFRNGPVFVFIKEEAQS